MRGRRRTLRTKITTADLHKVRVDPVGKGLLLHSLILSCKGGGGGGEEKAVNNYVEGCRIIHLLNCSAKRLSLIIPDIFSLPQSL